MLRALTQKVRKAVGFDISIGATGPAAAAAGNKNTTSPTVSDKPFQAQTPNSQSVTSTLAQKASEMVRPTMAAVAAATQHVLSPLKPLVPMIRFRKGTPTTHHTCAPGTGSATGSVPNQSGAIEDWQLPQKYRRRPIDENEIAYINRGGPDL